MALIGTISFTGSDGSTPSGVTQHPASTTVLTIVSNRGFSPPGGFSLYTFNTSPADANQEVLGRIYLKESYGSGSEPEAATALSSPGFFVCLRYDTSADTGYWVGWSGGRWKVIKRVAGVVTALASSIDVYQSTLVDFSVLYWRAAIDASNTIRLFVGSGSTTELLKVTDSSSPITATGKTGLCAIEYRWGFEDWDAYDGYTAPAAGPVITGPSGAPGAATSAKTVAENSTAVHTLTADVAVTWSLNGGADAARFAINPSTGALTFATAPDYENPTDADTNNTYVVVVRATATSGGATADQTVTVTVTNVAEPPLAPTIGTATAGNASASVAFTPPTNTGRPAITGYTATSSPGGFTGTGASSPITVSGLSNGTAYTFTVTATNADGTGPASAASNSVTPSAPGTAPSITSHPSNQTVTAGATATFSVSATGSGTLTYQWQRNGSNISGATSSSYTTPATTVSGGSANNGDLFRCVVTGDTSPAATSNAATLTVNAAGGISGAFTLPGAADRADKQEVTLHSVQALSALTVNGNGATVNGAPASLAANGFFRLRFDAQSVAWYRVG